MLATALQVWAGSFYLANKIFLAFAAFRENEDSTKKKLLIIGWSVYLIGLTPWVIIFISEKNWIVAMVEACGAPAMAYGLMVAIIGKGRTPKLLKWLSYTGAFIGLGISFWDVGFLVEKTQYLELGVAGGFLIGTLLLANKNPLGWVFFAIMNASNAYLMYTQNYYWLTAQQLASLFFVALGYMAERQKK